MLILIIIYMSFYTITQGYSGLVFRLGNIVGQSEPGLHVKIPIIESVQEFDTRLQTLNVDSSRILTQEQKYVLVDYYAKWRISNLSLYFTRTGGDAGKARILLKQKINDSLRAEFGKLLLTQVISDSRATIMQKLQAQANQGAAELGIKVIDVRIKRIDLPKEVSMSVFNSMSAGREAVAAKYRFDGKAVGEQIQAQADADAAVITAKAEAQAATIRAQGDAKAAKIYADAYTKDPDFYAFMKSLNAYKAVFSQPKNNVLVLKPDSEFFKYFNNQSGNETKRNGK